MVATLNRRTPLCCQVPLPGSREAWPIQRPTAVQGLYRVEDDNGELAALEDGTFEATSPDGKQTLRKRQPLADPGG